VQVLLVGESEELGPLERGLKAEGVAVESREQGPDGASGPAEIAAIARGLREFEAALGEGGPDAVVVASDSSDSLAAVLVATKLAAPVACVLRSSAAGVNADLIRHLADTALAAEPSAIVAWLRDTYTERR